MRISKQDVTISVGESFDLLLRDGNGDIMDVTWKADQDGYIKIDGNKITGVKSNGKIVVSCTFEGKDYSCVVRVKNAQ